LEEELSDAASGAFEFEDDGVRPWENLLVAFGWPTSAFDADR
jgi:hypothetical protein